MVEQNKLMSLGRRRFLKTLAGMGVGAATLDHITLPGESHRSRGSVTDAPQDGDSGSPMFHYDDSDDADYIIGVVAWNRDDDAAGNTADEFKRQLDGYWLC